MAPYLTDRDLTLYQGDAREVLASLPDESVHCVITSPPYWGLRDYGTGVWDGGDPGCDHKKRAAAKRGEVFRERGKKRGYAKSSNFSNYGDRNAQGSDFENVCGKCGARRVDQQLGLEPTFGEYVSTMVEVFREVRRVLRKDGTCWLNIGDSYAGGSGGRGDSGNSIQGKVTSQKHDGERIGRDRSGLKAKDLVGVPWRLAFALQDDGWYLRSDIIWSKPNPMPSSVTDRPTTAHEYLFLLSRSPRYFFDRVAVMEPAEWSRWGDHTNKKHSGSESAVGWMKPATKAQLQERGRRLNAARKDGGSGGFYDSSYEKGLRNIRSVWEIVTESYEGAHFATFPREIPRRCIRAGTSEKGCCPECGAPWERELLQGDTVLGWRPTCECFGWLFRWSEMDGEGVVVPRSVYVWPDLEVERRVTGLLVPGVVLDPFAGAGTTGLVARELGRRSVLVELSLEFAGLIAGRTVQLSLLS